MTPQPVVSGAAAAYPAVPYIAQAPTGGSVYVPPGFVAQLVPDSAGVLPPPGPCAGVAPLYQAPPQQQPIGAFGGAPAGGAAPAAQQDAYLLPVGYGYQQRTTRRHDRVAAHKQRVRECADGMGEAPCNPDRSITGPALMGMLCPGGFCHANQVAIHCGRTPKLCAKCCKQYECTVDGGPGHCQLGMSWRASNDLHMDPRIRSSGRPSGHGRY